MPGDLIGGEPTPRLPTRYFRTGTYHKLRIAERFGQPIDYADSLDPGELALAEAYCDVRELEEAQDRGTGGEQ